MFTGVRTSKQSTTALLAAFGAVSLHRCLQVLVVGRSKILKGRLVILHRLFHKGEDERVELLSLLRKVHKLVQILT